MSVQEEEEAQERGAGLMIVAQRNGSKESKMR